MPSISLDSVVPVIAASGQVAGLLVTVTHADNRNKAFDVKVTCTPEVGTSQVALMSNVGSSLNPDFPQFTYPATPTTDSFTIPSSLLPSACSCDGTWEVSVSWTFGPDTFEDSAAGTFDCGCPQATFDPPQVGPNCLAGRRTVAITAHVVALPGQAVIVYWEFGDGTGFSAPQPVPASGIVTMPARDYAPGSYTVRLHIFDPPGCPPVSFQISVPPCAADCPTVDDIDIEVASNCVDGERTVTLSATVSGGGVDRFRWNFGDGSQSRIVAFADDPQGTVNHSFPAPGGQVSTYQITLVVVGADPACVETVTRTVEIPGCGSACPEFDGEMTITRGDCVDGGTRRRMEVSVPPIDGEGAFEYRVDWGDGTPTETESVTESTLGHNYVPGNYTVTVTLLGPGDCETQISREVDVPRCTFVPPPVPDDLRVPPDRAPTEKCRWWNPACWNFCGALLAGAMAALIAASVVVIMGACSGNLVLGVASAGPFAAGLILLALWIAGCKGKASFCQILNTTIRVVEGIIALQLVVGLFLAIFIGLPCLIGAAISMGYWGVVLAILNGTARRNNCIIEQA